MEVVVSLEELHQKLKEQNLIGYRTMPPTSTGFREPEPCRSGIGMRMRTHPASRRSCSSSTIGQLSKHWVSSGRKLTISHSSVARDRDETQDHAV